VSKCRPAAALTRLAPALPRCPAVCAVLGHTGPPQGSELWVHLSHPWCDCRVAAGDRANIMGGTRTVDAEGRTHAYLDHSNGMFVLHPDVLLSGGQD